VRELTASFLIGTLTRHDAIATACRRHIAALRQFCADRMILLRLKVYGFACEVDEPDFQPAATAAQVVLDPHFQRSDLIVAEFGIVFSLYDALLLAPRPARLLVFHYGVTYPHVAAADSRPLLYKSYEQMCNLFVADEIFVTSQSVARELQRIGVPSGRITQLGLPAAVAARAVRPWPVSPPGQPCRLLYVGRFVPAKGIADLIEALALHRRSGVDARLTLAGSLTFSDRGYIENLRERAVERGVGDAITWRFNVPADVLSALYDEADALVIPSYHEGFCVPVVESYQHGRPVIASDAAALPETTGGLGLSYPCGDSEALAECMGRFEAARRTGIVATDAGNLDYRQWIKRVASHVEQFRPERFAAEMDQVYARHVPESEVEPVVRRAIERARGGVLAEIRQGATAPPPALTLKLQPFYDLLGAGLVPTVSGDGATRPAHAAEATAPPSRGRLAWIYFKRAVKRVPVVAPAAVWGKRRIVRVLQARHVAWGRFKQGAKRIPVLGRWAVRVARVRSLPRELRHSHAVVQEVRERVESLARRMEDLIRATATQRAEWAATADEAARRLGAGRPAPATVRRPKVDQSDGTNWLPVHPATWDATIRVAVGGEDDWPDYVRVRSDGVNPTDLTAEPDALPFPPGSVRELAIRELPGGTTRHRFEQILVPHWAELLMPGGLLRIYVSNPRARLELLAREADQDEPDKRIVSVDPSVDSITPPYVLRVLEQHGFTSARVVAERWAEGRPEAEIIAERRDLLRSSA
jgi:glycosyltransferase involved in cell wall biosynthesis